MSSKFYNLELDTTLGGDNASDVLVPSQKAIKTYVDNHSGSGGTSDYTALTNKPSINSVELNGNKTTSDLGLDTLINITYSELVTLKTNSQLKEGAFYRITDYVTTTNGTAMTSSNLNRTNTAGLSRSAGHQFDIVIQAISVNKLADICTATQHEGDTYFANSNLGAWQIWYDIENNTSKYYWAVTDGTGKGVIYRLIDEGLNECPYDFKNIQFYRDATDTKYNFGSKTKFNTYLASADGWYYTFSCLSGTTITDYSLIFKSACSNNKFYYGHSGLNNNVIICNTTSGWCYSNYFLGMALANTFTNNCYGNKLNGDFLNNLCNYYFSNNTFHGQTYDNVLDSNFSSNNIGSYFSGNKCGDVFQINTIGPYCQNNNISGTNFIRSDIGSYFQNNTIPTNYFQYCTVGNNFKYNTFSGPQPCAISCSFGNGFQYNELGYYLYYLNTKNRVQYVKIPAQTCHITFENNIVGSSETNKLDLTGIEIFPAYPQLITKDADDRIIYQYEKDGVTIQKCKETVTATEWTDLTPTMEVDNWDE